MTTTAEDKFEKLKERLDTVLENGGARDDVLAVLDLINKEKQDMTLALLKKTRLGVPVGKLTKNSDPDVASQAKNIILEWKKLTATTTTSTSGNGANTSSGNAVKRVSSSSSSSSAPTNKRSRKEAASSSSDASKHTDSSEVSKDEKRRAALRGLLQNALSKEQEKDDECFIYTPEEAARCIEEAVYEKHNKVANSDYGDHMRMLFLNFDSASRSDLRQAVLHDTDIKKWASMSSENLMSKQQRTELLRAEEEHIRTIKGVDPLANVPEGINQCSRCGSRRIHTYQLQTRGADEPMTIFYTCADCKKRWRG